MKQKYIVKLEYPNDCQFLYDETWVDFADKENGLFVITEPNNSKLRRLIDHENVAYIAKGDLLSGHKL